MDRIVCVSPLRVAELRNPPLDQYMDVFLISHLERKVMFSNGNIQQAKLCLLPVVVHRIQAQIEDARPRNSRYKRPSVGRWSLLRL